LDSTQHTAHSMHRIVSYSKDRNLEFNPGNSTGRPPSFKGHGVISQRRYVSDDPGRLTKTQTLSLSLSPDLDHFPKAEPRLSSATGAFENQSQRFQSHSLFIDRDCSISAGDFASGNHFRSALVRFQQLPFFQLAGSPRRFRPSAGQ
jgi:hypothetical protein